MNPKWEIVIPGDLPAGKRRQPHSNTNNQRRARLIWLMVFTHLIALMTVLSGGVRSSTDTSHWHPFSSYTSSVPRAVSAAREDTT